MIRTWLPFGAALMLGLVACADREGDATETTTTTTAATTTTASEPAPAGPAPAPTAASSAAPAPNPADAVAAAAAAGVREGVADAVRDAAGVSNPRPAQAQQSTEVTVGPGGVTARQTETRR